MKPDFPSLADEIAEPRPDVNIKVAAFTVSEKFINMHILFYLTVSPFFKNSFIKSQLLKEYPQCESAENQSHQSHILNNYTIANNRNNPRFR